MRQLLRVLAFAILIGSALSTRARADRPTFDPATIYKAPPGASPTEGPADAPVTIVVWSDYACGYCNRVQTTLDQLGRLYPGQLRYVHRQLPLDDDNTVAAEAGLAAAAQHRFRPMHDRLFGVGGRVDRTSVELLASQIGLDMVRFRADLDAGTYRAQIAADVEDARALGVSGTPTFFINGRAVHGAQGLKTFVDTVDQELARATKLAATHPADLYAALIADGHPTADGPAEEAKEDAAELDPHFVYRVGLGLPGHQLGPDDAPVTLVEWSDFQCPYCARQAPVIAQMRAKFGDQIRVVYRHMPMPFHSRAALDRRQFRDVVEAEGAAGTALGVDGTPTTFINGRPVIGAKPPEVFERLVQLELDMAKQAMARGVAARDVYALEMSGAIGTERSDPSRVPASSTVELAQPAIDRERSVAAACRRHDPGAAAALAGSLEGDARKRAAGMCRDEGVDLP